MDLNTSPWLNDMTWIDVEAQIERYPVVVLPVGATEQHGARLPLGTDTYFAVRLAEAAAIRTGCAIAPPLWYGWSPHHMNRPGTLTLRPETLSAVIEDVCTSLAAHGFVAVVILNGHRIANLPPLQIGSWRAQQTAAIALSIVDLEYLAGDDYRRLDMLPVLHADDSETSLMLHLAPDAVREAPYPPPSNADAAHAEMQGTVWYPPLQGRDTLAEDRWGTPTSAAKANAAKGAELNTALVERLAVLIEDMRSHGAHETAP